MSRKAEVLCTMECGELLLHNGWDIEKRRWIVERVWRVEFVTEITPVWRNLIIPLYTALMDAQNRHLNVYKTNWVVTLQRLTPLWQPKSKIKGYLDQLHNICQSFAWKAHHFWGNAMKTVDYASVSRLISVSSKRSFNRISRMKWIGLGDKSK